ncbi:MAG: flavodoxin family protein [Tsuneonella suprasediminis]|uniref:Flavodoxin family protein n=1 Tax=Tsuneonella suprasediminis TaxID=2306996 RepID=A0A419R062_9SPHN|nr:NAD(P)H-dependent oxidoreductase [Tsuneonella suprasediminis]RJX66880.1 flavodoxin family protein [Tsuneonella suprasediminis]UBS32304.1 NAD(P)H-dependent oxidoreductase [Altererythrobacter sp. N1]
MAPHLLIIWHSRTGSSEALARAAYNSAGRSVQLIAAEAIDPEDLLDAAGYLFVCPENLASMSGMMKEMFDRCYYPVLGQIEGRPYASIITAGSDGEGAQRQIDRIATGWRLRRVAEPIIVLTHAQTAEKILARKVLTGEQLRQAEEIGAALSRGVADGIF